MEHMGEARGQALGARGATHGWLRGCGVLLTSYPGGVVGPPAMPPCANAGGIPVGGIAGGTNIAGLPLKLHLADGGLLMRG